jgi:quercetin dioxygenase-like cupin family protein
MPVFKIHSSGGIEIKSGIRGRFVHGEKMTVGFFNLKAGSVLPEHAHPHEQISIIQSGEMELHMEGKIHRLSKGMVAVIPSNVPHEARAITDCIVQDVFQPVREEYLNT